MELDRYFSPKLTPFGRLSKPVRLDSKKHLEWIRSQPCIVTGIYGVDAHHVIRKSQGLNDYTTVPLRHSKHMDLHNTGIYEFEAQHGIDFKDAIIAKLVERIRELEK